MVPTCLRTPALSRVSTATTPPLENAFLNQEYAYEGINSLKMFGCFCSDFNGNGAVSTYTLNAEPGQVYRVTAQMLNPDFDSIVGTSSWGGMKIEFKNANQVAPARLIFYRDGVAHNQFDIVMTQEIAEIGRAHV